jgi:Tfp pilus assembly protein PilF
MYAKDAAMNRRPDAGPSKNAFVLTVMAMVYSRADLPESAIRSFNEAIKLDEKNDFAYLERGRLYLSIGRSSKAESDFKKAVALGNPEAKKMLEEKLQ